MNQFATYFYVIDTKITRHLEFVATFADGFVAWPDEIDLAPDAMYQAIKENGE